MIGSATGEAGVMPAAEIPFVEGDLDAIAESILIEQIDGLQDLLFRSVAERHAMEVVGGMCAALPERSQ